MTLLEQKQAELIELLEGQIIQLTCVSKIELGDDVIAEVKRLSLEIDRLTESKTKRHAQRKTNKAHRKVD